MRFWGEKYKQINFGLSAKTTAVMNPWKNPPVQILTKSLPSFILPELNCFLWILEFYYTLRLFDTSLFGAKKPTFLIKIFSLNLMLGKEKFSKRKFPSSLDPSFKREQHSQGKFQANKENLGNFFIKFLQEQKKFPIFFPRNIS